MILTNWIAKIIVKTAGILTPNTKGVAIYPFIFIYPPEVATNKLVRHEKVHLEQWKRYWIVGFPFIYTYQYFKYGYNYMPLEIEARS